VGDHDHRSRHQQLKKRLRAHLLQPRRSAGMVHRACSDFCLGVKMKLADMKPKADELIRLFWYPDNADSKTGFEVYLQYLSPEVRSEVEEKVRLRLQRENQVETAPGDKRRAIINEVLLVAVTRCKGVTFEKLKDLIPLGAEQVAANGGLEAIVPMDPSDPHQAKEARENILFLLDNSERFAQWAMGTCVDISRFQANDWSDRVKNLSGGRNTNSAQIPSTVQTT
jgi:hypothetical protein